MNKEKFYLINISLFMIILITIIAFISKIWVFTAIPIGFLFGFFLQKGDLCGASAFSEVVIMKDWQKMFGLWICIVVSMAGFAILDLMGIVNLNPKPLLWLSYIIGGVIFGIGMVLAGGCVSGCLYKSATGNINSMAALVGIPIGIAIAEYGLLNSFHLYMKSLLIKAEIQKSITLSTLTGIPFWILALFFVIGTVILILIKKNKNIKLQLKVNNSAKTFLFRSWKPWQAGLAIGILAIPAYLSSIHSGRNYPLGVTHGVLQAQVLITEKNTKFISKIPDKKKVQQATNIPKNTSAKSITKSKPKKVVWWLVALILSLIAGSFISGKLSGQTKLLPKPPEQTFVSFFGGILVGIGAAFATGCVIGNIMSGWALMSVGMFIFGIVTIITNWIITYFYLLGGKNLKINKKR